MILQTSEQKSKALHDAAPIEPNGYVGSWPHTCADTESQPLTPSWSDAAFAAREHGEASKGRNPVEGAS